MTLFRSKFAKLEALAAAKEDARTPAMLAAAQDELDRANADVILVPKTDTLKDGAALDAHLEALEQAAKDAKAAQAKAEKDLKAAEAKAEKDLEELKGQRVVPGSAASSKGEGGDNLDAAAKAEAARHADVHGSNAPWNAMADEMGFMAEPEAEKKETPEEEEAK